MFVEVLVELKIKNIAQTFTYHVPQKLEREIMIGKRVLIPFQNRKLEGFVLKIEKNSTYDYPVKDIYAVVDEQPVLNEEQLSLGTYISKKTLCNLIHAYQTMLPKALRAEKKTDITKKYTSYIIPNTNDLPSLPQKQKQILELVRVEGKILKKDANNISVSALQTLLKKGFVKEITEEVYRTGMSILEESTRPELSGEQKKVLLQIKHNQFQPYLLHGVTGSGKTEVYLRLIEETLNEKKEALVLVPEISLTPQLVETFQKRFGNQIAILHSRLSNGEKYDEWRRIQKKEVSIVVGARSAIFAPLTHLGVIIIDEEHSTTYKQENVPKYHAIDVALWRAKRHNCPLVLGSATPSIESYTRAKTGIYELCTMKNRIHQNLPEVTCIDMKDEIRKGNRILSAKLHKKIEETIDKKEQVILLLNRRGYTTISTCQDCGETHKCPACDIPLTYHKTSNRMRCHYCGYAILPFVECPTCHSISMNKLGMGTEKLEQYLMEEFPDISVLRMDNDTTTKKGSHERMIHDFEQGKYHILVGTQMIAKGLNFPNVTLVGVLQGDASLNVPDFRSAERTFDLLSQVAGRAGRSEKEGEVIFQGFHMDHYSIKSASLHDYDGFYLEEMKIRKVLHYSPYCNLCLITLRSKEEILGYQEGKKIASYFKKIPTIYVLGPSYAAIPKINHIYQVQIILKYKKLEPVYDSLKWLQENYRNRKDVILDIDINPVYM